MNYSKTFNHSNFRLHQDESFGFFQANVARLSRVKHAVDFFSESCYSKSNLDCNYTFLIDLAPNGIPYDVKSIIKV